MPALVFEKPKRRNFRDKFYKMTRWEEEFTITKMCIDFFKIIEFFKIMFTAFITYRMFNLNEHKKFFSILFTIALVNMSFNYIVYNRLVPHANPELRNRKKNV